MARMYVPSDLQALEEVMFVARHHSDGMGWTMAGPVSGHAVTAQLRKSFPDLDDEGLEHYAMTEAAQDSLSIIGKDPGRNRRVVLAIDTPSVVPRLGALTQVETGDVVIPHDVVAYMVDTDDAVDVVAAAAVAIRLDDDDADELVQRCLDHELGWYAATEVDDVLRLS